VWRAPMARREKRTESTGAGVAVDTGTASLEGFSYRRRDRKARQTLVWEELLNSQVLKKRRSSIVCRTPKAEDTTPRGGQARGDMPG